VRKSPHGGLDLERWEQARVLFDELADLGADDQRRRLSELAARDSSLASEVQSLLHHDRVVADTISDLVADAAGAVFDGRDIAAGALPDRIGRYRILALLGEGGMGEVFLAEDPTLARQVAVKRPAALLASDPEARSRLLREARAAATLNHPHVCVVHEIGEDEHGWPFIAMEHLEGETLASRIARGRLPIDQVVRLGLEAVEALEAAHAHGVVHRDIKPSNIMLTSHGAKLLDFGLASLGRDAASPVGFMGTLPYMSPEQLRGEVADGRSDLFSLGVVLYEAATGRRPFDGSTPKEVREAILTASPVPPSRTCPGLSPSFDALVLRLLSRDPDGRYQNAGSVAADLARLAAPRRARRWWVAGGVAAAALIAAVLLWRPPPGPTPAVPARATVLVGEFANTTGDPAFDGALREALIVQLQQTPFISVVPAAGVRESLKLMGQPPDAPLTPRLAREVAVRRGIPAWIAGSIAPSASGYIVALTATQSQSGELLARESVAVPARSDVVAGLGRAAIQLRARLGESQASLQQFSTPIEQATTGSLDALRAYALGVEQSNRGEYALAATLYERAVRIDPDFAIAHKALAREEWNSNNSERVVAAATRAYELRARASEQEQARIVVFFHSTVTGDLRRAISAASEWQRTYPAEWRPHHTLANLHFDLGDYARAETAGREAVRLNPDVAAAYSNLAGALFAQDRFDEARELYRQAMARGFDAPEYHAFLWRIAYYTGDADEMRRQEDWAASSSTWAYNIPALAAALQGRWRESREWSARARTLFRTRGQEGLVALADRYDALTGAAIGDCEPARTLSEAAVARRPDEEHAQAALAWALCGERAKAGKALRHLETSRPDDTRIQHVWLPSIRAALADGESEHEEALEHLRAATLSEGAGDSWPLFLRAEARLRSGDSAGARSDYERIVANRGRTFWWPLVPLSHLGRARAAARAGDVAVAREAYADLFAVWHKADADLPVLTAARREQADIERRPLIRRP
jgi:tetratricopeptide (TPR) repeat protein